MRDTPVGRVLSAATLEMSLKPVRSYDRDTLTAIAQEIAGQWRPLLSRAVTAEVMLWTADGSELLDFTGDLSDTFVWGSTIGFANLEHDAYVHPVPAARQGVPYTAAPAQPSYGDLKLLVSTLRQVLSTELDVPVRIGTTFDTGPEFADSEFKFVRHPEVMARGADAGLTPTVAMLQHGSVLHGDRRRYASFPTGIPEGTSFGTFLGRQAAAYLPALGFDYLWLSNGFGLSPYAWTAAGVAFDGTRFDASAARSARADTLRFWSDLRAELTQEVRIRGTNHTAGIDIGSDGVPALEIYERGYVSMPPPNSPWGPLNHDFGIEITGYLSRIAAVPARSYMFRFYANDPWFWQQPWWDFYHREPFDIDLMTSVSRVVAGGEAVPADHVQVFSIDTSRGDLDERCGREVSTAIVQSLESRPDAPGPLVWVYPMREYEQALRPGSGADPGRGYDEDLIVTGAVNAGLALNTVCSTDELGGAVASGTLRSSILLVPTGALQARPGVVESLTQHMRGGGDVMLYGALRDLDELSARWLGVVATARPLEGLARLEGLDRLNLDGLVREGPAAQDVARIDHVALLSGGGLAEVPAPEGSASAPAEREIMLEATLQGGGRRVYAAMSRPCGAAAGRLAWVRGSSPILAVSTDQDQRDERPDVGSLLDPGVLLRGVVSLLGLAVRHRRHDRASPPVITTVHRSRGAFWFSAYAADTTVEVAYRLPAGAPILTGRECRYEAGGSSWHHTGKSLRAECRVLVERAQPGVISCHDLAPQPAEMTRSIAVSGLEGADVVLLPPPDVGDRLRVEVDGREVSCEAAAGGEIRLSGVSGPISMTW